MTNPNSLQAAVASANRLARARQILDLGYRFYQDADSDVIAVVKPGRLAASYWINLMTPGCSCPDELRHPGDLCKHKLAWQILQAEQAAEEACLESLCARYDDAEGFLDRIPTPTPVSIAIKDIRQAWENDLSRVQTAIASHGSRRTNFITAHQEHQQAGRLESALVLLSQTRL